MSIQHVISTMERLTELHQQLFDSGEEKKQAIIKNDIEKLTQIMTQENRLLKQVAEVEKERVDAAYAFLHEKGIRSQLNLTVTELLRLVFNVEERFQLQDSQNRLLNVIHALKRQNEVNQQLIHHALEFIDFSLNVFVGAEDDLIYQNPAHQSSNLKKNNFFDTRA
ncbi:flagellar protein FlgN [Paenibacillus sediminis]|uniref:Flagellar biosynthesis/type III secretory pathway chaperone n=1 Tax=Paenibacillus sediminis TaxID=664909 RepID=A0ABS4H2B7_9BACL|nr:flagellar biosynthesis/type III secretory pathway chaperone [Paenibacillus sediminis]